MRRLFATFLGGIAALALTVAAHDVQAAPYTPQDNLYCSDAAYTGGLTTGAVDFQVQGGGSYNASDCYGAFDIKEARGTGPGSLSEVEVLEDIWKGDLTNFGKYEAGGSFTGGDPLNGVTITDISATADGWTITWEGNGALPITINMAVLLKAGSGTNNAEVNDAGTWWLPQVVLNNGSSTGSGSFDIEWLNNGGQTPGLSHLTLAAQLVDVPVPEPATLALLGFGLAGLGVAGVARRRRS